MNKYAIIAIAGKQFRVEEGMTLEIPKLDKPESTIVMDQVLLVGDGDKIQVGTPTVPGVSVYASYVEDKKGEKIQVFKYKSKSKYRKMRGARQTYSYLKIDSIGTKPTTKKADATKAPVTSKPKGRSVKKAPAKKVSTK